MIDIKIRKYSEQLFFRDNIDNDDEIIIMIPDASPSSPSIQFMALVTPTIQKITNNKLKVEFNSKLKLLIPKESKFKKDIFKPNHHITIANRN